MLLRFIISERHAHSDRETGIFSAPSALEERGELHAGELEWFRESELWLNRNLRRPGRLAWSSRPNASERAPSCMAILSTMVGAMVLSRAVNDEQLSK
jgi:hypothetical protein